MSTARQSPPSSGAPRLSPPAGLQGAGFALRPAARAGHGSAIFVIFTLAYMGVKRVHIRTIPSRPAAGCRRDGPVPVPKGSGGLEQLLTAAQHKAALEMPARVSVTVGAAAVPDEPEPLELAAAGKTPSVQNDALQPASTPFSALATASLSEAPVAAKAAAAAPQPSAKPSSVPSSFGSSSGTLTHAGTLQSSQSLQGAALPRVGPAGSVQASRSLSESIAQAAQQQQHGQQHGPAPTWAEGSRAGSGSIAQAAAAATAARAQATNAQLMGSLRQQQLAGPSSIAGALAKWDSGHSSLPAATRMGSGQSSIDFYLADTAIAAAAAVREQQAAAPPPPPPEAPRPHSAGESGRSPGAVQGRPPVFPSTGAPRVQRRTSSAWRRCWRRMLRMRTAAPGRRPPCGTGCSTGAPRRAARP